MTAKLTGKARGDALGTIKGCDEGSALPLGETFGYLVMLDNHLPNGFRPKDIAFVPHVNIEAAIEGPGA